MYRLKKIGQVLPKKASEIKSSRLGIGFEKLDRNVFDPERCYDRLEQLGAKWVRIQSGWCKTESTRGHYDFHWLDKIVDNLIARGMRPWMCLCYGNELYDSTTSNKTGAVGCPPVLTEEAAAAWDEYVKKLVAHFKGRVSHYEVWNEPDGQWCWKHGPSGAEYGRFVIRTSKVIQSVDPEAKIFAGSTCMRELDFITCALNAGMADYITDITYHHYQVDVEYGITDIMKARRALLDSYRPGIGIIQGETGCPSEPNGRGALHDNRWTEEKQKKYIARMLMTDLSTEAKFASVFSLVDMYEDLSGKDTVRLKENYGFFGLLREQFDGNVPTGDYEPKPSYKAMQTICSLVTDKVHNADLPLMFVPRNSLTLEHLDTDPYRSWNNTKVPTIGMKHENGASAFTYWAASEILSSTTESTVSIMCFAMPENVKLIDICTGDIYAIPEEMIEKKDGPVYVLNNLPLLDSPLMLTFGDFADKVKWFDT